MVIFTQVSYIDMKRMFYMLTTDQMKMLQNDKEYKKTRGYFYNWKFAKGIVLSPDFNIKIDFSVNGNTYSSLSICQKVFIFLVKRFIIAKEIGNFRNEIVENILNSSIELSKIDLKDYIREDMKWVSFEEQKIENIRNITVKFVETVDIQIIFFKITELDDKDERCKFMSNLLDGINFVFVNTIKTLKKAKLIQSDHDYNDYILLNESTINQNFIEHQHTGNLCSVDENTSNGSEIKL